MKLIQLLNRNISGVSALEDLPVEDVIIGEMELVKVCFGTYRTMENRRTSWRRYDWEIMSWGRGWRLSSETSRILVGGGDPHPSNVKERLIRKHLVGSKIHKMESQSPQDLSMYMANGSKLDFVSIESGAATVSIFDASGRSVSLGPNETWRPKMRS